MTAQADRYVINSVLRATQILESFSFDKREYTNAELSKKLGLNRSTVTRLLYSLEKAGFLERVNGSAKYKLTYKIYQIGKIYIKQTSLHREAMPLLTELASTCKETTHLAVLDKYEVFFIDWIETSRSIGLMSLTGNNLPAYCTANGKVLLAHLDSKVLDDFFRRIPLKSHTPNTITDQSQLRHHLDEVRNQGYAIDNAEFQLEVMGIASPVKDKNGDVVASISVAGPIYRINAKKILKKMINSVVKTAGMISRRLGYVDENMKGGS